jgi:hypothetical protein
MNLEISVKNYRCFNDRSPARLKLTRGTSALIGANNVGKSTLLRLFYELRALFRKVSTTPESLITFFEQGCPLPPLPNQGDAQEMFHRGNFQDIVLSLSLLNPALLKDSPWARECFIIISRKNLHCQARFHSFTGLKSALEENQEVLSLWRNAFLNLSRTFYSTPFHGLATGDYANSDLHYGQHFYRLYRDLIHPSHAALSNAPARLEDEIKNLFHLNHFALISPGPDQPLIVQIDKTEYPLAEVGSGIAQVLQLFVHALAFKPDTILVDEPECHLHPSYQADFLTALSGMARVGLIFSTHNGGLAKTVAERTYLVERSPDDTHTVLRETHTQTRLSEVMGEVGFGAQKQKGCTKVLLVEGPTEIKAVRQILLKMQAGNNIVLLPLGGGSMITPNRADELNEVKKIGKNVYALIDSEKHSAHAALGQDRIGFQQVCQKVGIACHILERRSFENYFTERSVKRVLGKSYRALAPYEDVKDRYPNWQKTENWKIVRDMPLKDLEKTDLSLFLQQIVEDPCRI